MPRSTNEPQKQSLIGQALVEDEVITEAQLGRALRVQALLEQPKQLGEVLIDLGYVGKQAISDTVAKHGRSMRIGDMLLEQGIITETDLVSALELHKEQDIRVGEALIRLGILNEHTLLFNLAHQSGMNFIEPELAMIEPGILSGVSPDYLERFVFVPFSRNEDGVTTVVVPEIENASRRDAIEELYHGNYTLALGPPDSIKQTIEEFRNFRVEEQGARSRDAEGGEDSVIQLVNHLITRAIEARASDLHIEPMSDRIRVRFRIDGVLVYKTDLPIHLLPRIASRIKIMAECNIAEHQRHQGGRIQFTQDHREYDLRLSVYITVHGECLVMRILSKQAGLVGLDELGMNPSMLERFRSDVLDQPAGVVLITGPTGSGKTTTLYSSLDYCNDVATKITTAEDPVEYMIDGIIQCSIHDKAGRTFELTLREIVRQDPDIIVLGEIRDHTSAGVAIQAALTGHKVYSTFHTEDTIGGLLRLIDMDIETFLISSTVISVLAQRLLRRICTECVAPYMPTPRELHRLGLDIATVREYEFKKGHGCKHCNYTGFFGRVGAYELLILNDAIKEAILAKRPAHVIRQISMDTTGLVSMREDAIAKVVRGETVFDEVLRHTPSSFSLRPLRQILSMTQ
ncbi:MAG: secretion system protein E [Nitrospiraceae bacterium]|nr:secretion system protein E [Nitrospiraceae bacterium]